MLWSRLRTTSSSSTISIFSNDIGETDVEWLGLRRANAGRRATQYRQGARFSSTKCSVNLGAERPVAWLRDPERRPACRALAESPPGHRWQTKQLRHADL